MTACWSECVLVQCRIVIQPGNVCFQKSRVEFIDLALVFASLEYCTAGLMFS